MNHQHFILAVKYIYQHIDQPITLEAVAATAGISVSSLKRLFQKITDQSPGAFIRRLRMELAFRSLQSKADAVLEAALAAGFENHAAFSRCFKSYFGYSPSLARQKINIVHELDHIQLEEPDIIELNEFTLQGVTETGYYAECAAAAWQKLQQHLMEKITDDFSGVFIGIGHDNPHDGQVSENAVRFTAAVALCEQDIELGKFNLTKANYARFHYHGKVHNIGLAYHYIYGAWSENSGFNINDKQPAFLMFDDFPNAFKEQYIMIHVSLR